MTRTACLAVLELFRTPIKRHSEDQLMLSKGNCDDEYCFSTVISYFTSRNSYLAGYVLTACLYRWTKRRTLCLALVNLCTLDTYFCKNFGVGKQKMLLSSRSIRI